MVYHLCFLDAILIIVALVYELCKVCLVHYTVTVNTNPSHFSSHHLTAKWVQCRLGLYKIPLFSIVRICMLLCVPEVPHTAKRKSSKVTSNNHCLIFLYQWVFSWKMLLPLLVSAVLISVNYVFLVWKWWCGIRYCSGRRRYQLGIINLCLVISLALFRTYQDSEVY